MAKPSRAGGVTLITHGFNSDVASWVIPMQDRVAHYGALTPTNTACYEISITQSGGQYSATATFLAGTNPLAAASGEILIKLDWSTLSGGNPSTLVIATNAANALLATNLIPALGGRPLVEMPLHLVGHSRGASVIAEMARALGAQGVWVDQLTPLDPVPVSAFGDPAMKLYANILYADNYWQNLGDGLFVPNGQSLSGAYNRHLLSLNGGYSSSHSDVHLWYHGTIDFNTPITVDSATITATERTNWWTSFEQRGTNAGFRLSSIAGGDRLSSAEPAGAGNGRISDGFNRFFQLGDGVTTNRSALPVNNGAWPNVLRLWHDATNPISAGAAFGVSFYQQTGTNASAIVKFSLDRDANPYNGNETVLQQFQLSATGTNAVQFVSTNLQTGAGITSGTYRLLATVTAAGRTRHFHAQAPLVIASNPSQPWLAPLGFTNGVFAIRVNGAAGQNIVTEVSTNLTLWNPLSTNTVSGNGFDVTDSQTASRPAKFYRAVLRP